MKEAIFLSAGVPDPKRGPGYAATADSVAINAAVTALVHVTLGRRPIIWGGHPAITPMLWVIAQDIGVEYGRWVRLYQSRFFEDEYPQDNEQFDNVTYANAVKGDREGSLLLMRKRMFSEHEFSAAVFIGGMDGIVHEFELFRHMHPQASVLPILSSGGATLELQDRLDQVPAELFDELDYVALFHRLLDISVKEERFKRPEDQPENASARYWDPVTRL